MHGQVWPHVRWVLIAQTILTLIAAALFGIFASWAEAPFVLLGGAITALLTVVFAIRLFSVDAKQDPHGATAAFFRGAAFKLLAAVLIFGAVAIWLPDHALAVIVGFSVASLSYWLALKQVI